MTARTIQRYGWARDLPDHRDLMLDPTLIVDSAALPRKFSLRDKMPAVYDQGQLGSCTANAIAGCLEFEAIKQGEAPVTPSRLFIYYEERRMEGTADSDSGAQIRDGIKVVASEGAPPETDWPYDINRFAERPPQSAYSDATGHHAITYRRVLMGGSHAPLRSAIHNSGPVAFGFSVPDYFETYDASSIPLGFPTSSTHFIGGHAVCAVGWDYTRQNFPVNVIEVRNSWGADWGNEGYYWMDAKWFNNSAGLCDDFWVISRVS